MVYYNIQNACLTGSKEFYFRWEKSILQKFTCFNYRKCHRLSQIRFL